MEYSDKRAELIDWIAETVTDWNDEPRYTHEELEEIAKELGIKVNNYKVLEEYRRRHPEETKKEEVKDGQEI